MLTQDRVRELFDYDPETGHLIRKVTPCNNVNVGDRAGCLNSQGYLRTMIDNISYRNHRIVWLWYYGYLPENYIDHINREPADNRIENLREVSRQCNLRNTANLKSNISGVKGVCWYAAGNKWQSTIRLNGKQIYLGHYKDFDDAVCARLAVEQCLDWSGCDSESPAFKYVKENILC